MAEVVREVPLVCFCGQNATTSFRSWDDGEWIECSILCADDGCLMPAAVRNGRTDDAALKWAKADWNTAVRIMTRMFSDPDQHDDPERRRRGLSRLIDILEKLLV